MQAYTIPHSSCEIAFGPKEQFWSHPVVSHRHEQSISQAARGRLRLHQRFPGASRIVRFVALLFVSLIFVYQNKSLITHPMHRCKKKNKLITAFKITRTIKSRHSERVSIFLTAHQHYIGYSVFSKVFKYLKAVFVTTLALTSSSVK